MPKKMDFETKYQAGGARPFDQKNEMFKRVRWDPAFKDFARRYYGVVVPRERPGFRHEDIALRNAAWLLEMGYARGVIQSNFGLYGWADEKQGVSMLPEGLRFDARDVRYNARLVKKAARLYGADLVGICRYDRRWTYTKGYDLVRRFEYDIEIPPEYGYVINMAVAMDHEYYKYTPNFIGGADTGLGYSKMAFTAGLLAQFLRQLGYKAIPTGNDTTLSVPYAIQAGLGELGRNGFLITRDYGPRVRLCKVFTDFPMDCDEPVEFGVTRFCELCKKCAEHCPSRAISTGPRTNEPINVSNAGGSLKWYVDGEKCFEFWARNTADCGNCIRVCPFNKPKGALHGFVRWLVEHVPAVDRALLYLDDLFGYGRAADPAGFWQKETSGKP